MPFHSEETPRLLHVHDLPQLYTKPPASTLLETLELFKRSSSTFNQNEQKCSEVQIDPDGVPRYLTSIISSSLAWLDSDEARDQIWEAASARLSERSGRNAAPSLTRRFRITDTLNIQLHEPSLTEDNLGLKTWTSSLLLARRLDFLRKHLPAECKEVLELGAGTGLVGIAAAYLWKVNVTLTDLPEIVPNLQANVTANEHLLQAQDVVLNCRILDWSDTKTAPVDEEDRYLVILSADPIYSAEHPRLLVDTVRRWLSVSAHARFIVELPLRKGYEKERADLRKRLEEVMEVVEEGTEVGYDDWEAANGMPMEVECWWSVWRWKTNDLEG